MEWLKELLTKAGLEDEAVINAIIEDHKKEAPKHMVPKDVFNEATIRAQNAETNLAARDQQLKDLQGKAGGDSKLQDEIKRLQEENEETKAKAADELKKIKLDHAIQQNLMAAKAKDITIAQAAFDLQKVTLDDQGKLVGFDEQLKAVQESHAWLFEGTEPTGTGGSLGNRTPGKATLTKEDFAKMTYTERVTLRAKDPDTYNLMTSKED